jgi:predicted MFS family arabinose efflux permease
MKTAQPTSKIFTKYQVFIMALLAVLQFTVILDFIVISPLGAQLLKELNIATSQFGLVVSVYAFSAGISGILAAGFADSCLFYSFYKITMLIGNLLIILSVTFDKSFYSGNIKVLIAAKFNYVTH